MGLEFIQAVALAVCVAFLNRPPDIYCYQQKLYTAKAMIILCAINASCTLIYTSIFAFTRRSLRVKKLEIRKRNSTRLFELKTLDVPNTIDVTNQPVPVDFDLKKEENIPEKESSSGEDEEQDVKDDLNESA